MLKGIGKWLISRRVIDCKDYDFSLAYNCMYWLLIDLFVQAKLWSCYQFGCKPTVYKKNGGIRIKRRRRPHYGEPSLQMQEPSIGEQDAWLWQWQVEVQLVPYSPRGQVWEQLSPWKTHRDELFKKYILNKFCPGSYLQQCINCTIMCGTTQNILASVGE